VAALGSTLATLDIKRATRSEPLAEGMGLGVSEVELDGRRGRSFRLASDGTGKQQNQERKRNTGRDSSAAVG
jgi:hypothetical protein